MAPLSEDEDSFRNKTSIQTQKKQDPDIQPTDWVQKHERRVYVIGLYLDLGEKGKWLLQSILLCMALIGLIIMSCYLPNPQTVFSMITTLVSPLVVWLSNRKANKGK